MWICVGLSGYTMGAVISPKNGSVRIPDAPKRLYALIGTFILAGALPGCAVFPKSFNPAADKSITADVKSRLARDPEFITPGLIDVQTVNGVVYLSGTVGTSLQQQDAENAARQANNVVQVVNSLCCR
jgi:enamine deaminase RidA (YjgF/YER057c/UK114 family)